MHRKALIESILFYKSTKWCSQQDLVIADQFIEFIKNHDRCFQRELESGHLTASCWLWNPEQDACLFTHHKKLQKWLQLGGHADGHTNLLEVAIGEAKEESGLDKITPISEHIFDLSIHSIPENPFEKAHLHFDVRYLLQAEVDEPLKISDESIDLRWVKLLDFDQYDLDASILKMLKKLTYTDTASA